VVVVPPVIMVPRPRVPARPFFDVRAAVSRAQTALR
jgi:hypothetical protein